MKTISPCWYFGSPSQRLAKDSLCIASRLLCSCYCAAMVDQGEKKTDAFVVCVLCFRWLRDVSHKYMSFPPPRTRV